MMHLHSISTIVDDIFDKLDESSLQVLKTTPEEEVIRFHHGWGTSIRNTYGLWQSDHPLTTNWHTKPETHVMDGIFDMSPDHPDAISQKIIEGVWKKANA